MIKPNASLNDIVYYLAGKFDKAEDNVFINELKFAVKNWRATLIRRDIEANGASPHYSQHFTLPVKETDSLDTCVVDIGCKVLVGNTAIPEPIRTKDTYPFHYVGAPGFKKSFGYIKPEALMYSKCNTYTGKDTKYTYINGKIYIYGNLLFDYVQISGIFVNPIEIGSLCIDSVNCYTDSEPFMAPADMINQIITSLLSSDLTIPIHKDKEITVVNQ